MSEQVPKFTFNHIPEKELREMAKLTVHSVGTLIAVYQEFRPEISSEKRMAEMKKCIDDRGSVRVLIEKFRFINIKGF